MRKITSLVNWLGNHKYAAAIVLFAILLGFVDENSLYHRYENQKKLSELKSEIRSYQDRYDNDTKKLEDLTNSLDAVYRVAREHYYMKRANEDIYVFSDTTSIATNEAAQ